MESFAESHGALLQKSLGKAAVKVSGYFHILQPVLSPYLVVRNQTHFLTNAKPQSNYFHALHLKIKPNRIVGEVAGGSRFISWAG